MIGNAGYRHAPSLKNPLRDADAIAAALRSAGFQNVALVDDADRERLIAVLQDFARAAAGADWAIVYYAGHGIEMGGENYLIPIDAKLADDVDVPGETVSLDMLLKTVEGAAVLRLVLLDACRDNPFLDRMRQTDRNRSVDRGLAPITPTGGTVVIYATRAGEVALDGVGDNSPFAMALARGMTTPGLEIGRFLRRVRDDVMQATDNRQQPFAYGTLSARGLYFVPQ